MRKISLIHQTPGRHGPRHWLSGLLACLVCLVNIFSAVGIGFALPTSQATRLAHPARSTQSAPHVSQQGLHPQVSTQKAPLHSLKIQTPVQKMISHKSASAPLMRLRPHGSQIPATTDLTIEASTPTPASVSVNDVVSYTLTVINVDASTSTSGAIIVTDTLPTGLTNTTGITGTPDFGHWYVSSSGNTVTATFPYDTSWSTGFFPPITITATANGAAFDLITHTASVLATNADDNSNPDNDTVSIHVTVLRPDLGLVITDNSGGRSCMTTGTTPTTNILTVTNNAAAGTGSYPTTASTITLSGNVPAALNSSTTTVSGTNWVVTFTPGGSSAFSATYTHSLPITASTSLAPLVIRGTISPTAGPTLTTTATLTDDAMDTTLGDKGGAYPDGTNTINVCPPDLGLVITDNSGGNCIMIGATATNTFTVTNNTTLTSAYATGPITITGAIPASLNNPTFSPTDWTITGRNGTNFIATYTGSLPIAAGVALTPLTVSGTISTPASPTLVTTATLTDNALDTTTADKGGTHAGGTHTINVCRADLAIIQTHSPAISTFQVGQSITYTLTINNNNTANTASVLAGQVITVTDMVPAGLTAITATGTGWSFNNTSTVITATYTVPISVAISATLAPIMITGTFSAASVGTTITNTATVSSPLDIITTGETEQTATNTISVGALPDLSTNLVVTNAGCNNAPVSYALTISDAASAGPVFSTGTNLTPISVLVTAPSTLTGVNLTTTSGWSIAGLTATYTGTYPVPAGTTLPSITITGTPVLPATSPITLSAKVSIANTATTTLVDTNPLNDTTSSTFTLCTPNLAIAVAHQTGTAPFVAGQSITYTITVTNTSPVAVPAGSAITVTDTFPAGLTNTWALGSNWSLSIANGTLTGTYIGTYPVPTGALSPITVYGTLTSATGATASNTATVTLTPATGTPVSSSATDTFAVTTFTNTPDVAISFVHTGTACVANNGAVTYTLGVTNGATAATLPGQVITVTTTLPTNLTGITISTPGNWTPSFSGNVMTATYNAAVATGAALPPITIIGNLTNVTAATLTSTATLALANDTNATNNTATDILTICTPDLAIVKTHVGTGPFKIGDPVTFNLAVTNVGTAPILAGQPITVTDLVPSGISSVTATAATEWTITVSDNTVIANYSGTYPVAAAAVLTPILVSGQVSSLDPAGLTNTTMVHTPGDATLKNNTSTDSLITTLPSNNHAPDLSVIIDSPSSCVSKNNHATFTFKVSNGSNAGPIAASAPITLTFRVPDGLDQITFKGSHWTWKKEGAIITASYVRSSVINAGDDLSSFALTGIVTKSSRKTVWLGVRAYEHGDSNRKNDTDDGKFSVC